MVAPQQLKGINMPIDPNIPLQAQNVKIESPMNQLASVGEAMKIGEMTRGIQTQNKLRELYSQGVDVSTPEGFKQLATLDPATALKLRADALQGRKLEGDIKKTGVEIDQKTYDLVKQRTSDLAFNPSDENIIAHLQDGVKRGEVTRQQADMTWKGVASLNPEQRAKYFTELGVKADKRYEMSNISESQKQSNATAIRGQNLTNERALENQKLLYGPDVVASTQVDSKGNVTHFNRQGQVIGTPGQVGKQSATYEKTAALQKQMGRDLDLAITEIENAIKPGGILEKSTASGAGKLRDAAGNFIGYATEGSIAAASLKPIADLGLKMVPRFEGPQSDKDTASYKEAAGQLANESLPVATRQAAAKTVVRLMKSRKGQFVNEAMANEGIGASAPALPAGFKPD
jgi:hypothetical protein